MPRFAYSARDRAGTARQGDLEAPSRKDALRILVGRGLQVASVTEIAEAGKAKAAKSESRKAAAAGKAAGQPSPFEFSFAKTGSKQPRRAERLTFLEALHDLTTSGLSAGEAVRLLSVRIKDPRLRALSGGLWESLSEGAPLSRALGEFPQVFDPATVNLVQAGEATGSLSDTLARIIAHLTEQRELRRQLMTALAYPIFMVFVALGVIIFFMTYLLPQLQGLLDSLGGSMPVSTQLLMNLSHFARSYGLFVLIAATLGLFSFWRWRATEAGRVKSDEWMLKVPLLGPFVVAQTVLAFSQTLYVLLENGITASEALRMTERQIDNRVHQRAFAEANARVLEGEALSVSLMRTGCFPDLVLDRLAVGENTGNIVRSLKDISSAYRKVVSNQLSTFTKVIASGVLMCVFIFVGFIALAIVSAVFKVSTSFKMG